MIGKTYLEQEKPMTPEEYLEKPYHYILVWDKESKTWTGKVKEFPGCVTQGDFMQIHNDIFNAAFDWIVAALAQGQKIPEPEGI